MHGKSKNYIMNTLIIRNEVAMKNRKHYYVYCPDCFSANIVEIEKETIIEEADENGK